ncbi:MAG TPA: hypothetical protein VFI13_12675 [Gemmatimonadales bacterium]|nr:hypothetical protein [Gemmatimonadales bacterium]
MSLSLVIAPRAIAQELQQQAVPASLPSTPAPAPTPAPHPSSLYARDDAGAPTIAAAQKEHAEAMRGRNHTIVVSTTVIVLSAIILILLIA